VHEEEHPLWFFVRWELCCVCLCVVDLELNKFKWEKTQKTLILYVCSSSNSSSSSSTVGKKLAKTVCLTTLVQALTTIIEITVFWESPNQNWSNIDFVVNLRSKRPMGGDYYFYFKICLDDWCAFWSFSSLHNNLSRLGRRQMPQPRIHFSKLKFFQESWWFIF
jgi:hypothetical protein